MAAVSGGVAVLAAGTAPFTVPVGLVAAVFAYSFRKRKAACDAIIDDPPRQDFHAATRPQRGWFKPEALAGQLTEVQIELARELAEGDALLRAAVRADERAQGAVIAGRFDLAEWQASLSDRFFDEFVARQPRAAYLAVEVSDEVRVEPAYRALPPVPDSPRSVFESLDPNARTRLEEAGVSTNALREMRPRTYVTSPSLPADLVWKDLRNYSSGERQRGESFQTSRSSRAPTEDRLRAFAHEWPGRAKNE